MNPYASNPDEIPDEDLYADGEHVAAALIGGIDPDGFVAEINN